MEDKKLKPCPICGGVDFAFGHPFVKFSEDRMYIIRCKSCDMQFIPCAMDWDEAIEKLNRRPS